MYREIGLTLEEFSYFYGLLITDGTMTIRNNIPQGIHIELSVKDKDVIEKLHTLFDGSTITSRTRNTNFSDNYTSYKFNYYKQEFCYYLIDECGYPIKDKTINAKPPIIDYSKKDFWRGAFDGDGSLGLRKTTNYKELVPFISFTTYSEELRNELCNYLTSLTGYKYNPKRNKRDNIYNIGSGTFNAIKIATELYKDATIYLDRKYNKYLEMIEWRK